MFASAKRRDAPPITVTIKRTQELSGLGLTKVYDLINTGKLETVFVGRRRLVSYRSLEKVLLQSDEAPPRRRGRPRKAANGGERP